MQYYVYNETESLKVSAETAIQAIAAARQLGMMGDLSVTTYKHLLPEGLIPYDTSGERRPSSHQQNDYRTKGLYAR